MESSPEDNLPLLRGFNSEGEPIGVEPDEPPTVKVKHLFQAIHVIHRKQTMFNSKLLYAWSRRNSLRCIKFPATRVQLMRTGHGICSP